MSERLFYFGAHVDTPSAEMSADDDRRARHLVDTEGEANLISSETNDDDWHLPVIDIDHDRIEAVRELIGDELGAEFAAQTRFLPSKTDGHFHAYIDAPVRWEDFEHLLMSLADRQLIEVNYANVSIARRAAFVRKPTATDDALTAMLVDGAAGEGLPF